MVFAPVAGDSVSRGSFPVCYFVQYVLHKMLVRGLLVQVTVWFAVGFLFG